MLNLIGIVLLPMYFAIVTTPPSLQFDLPQTVRIGSTVALAASLTLSHLVRKQGGCAWPPWLGTRKERRLVTGGIYAFIRHPMYLQIWIWVVLQGLVLQNWLVEAYGIAAWLSLYCIRVPREERMMVESMGDAYSEYMETTGRILPGTTKSAKGAKRAKRREGDSL
jgi:protein-S-isoprenylcysteine O-methyltransferase Ste14